MLGSYSDKKNLDQLHSFEEDEGEEIKLMLVINKLTEGKHVKGISGVILLRELDEDSIILLQQIMGRCIFPIDEDNPIEEDEIPIIIDIPNNIINANWDKVVNTYTVKDDEELLRDIIDWIERHGEKLPDIESTGREEYRKAVTLKRIQEKYIKYIEEENEGKITEKIQRIIELGEEIDLWNEILPDKLDKDGQVIPIEKLIHINVFHVEEKIGRLVEGLDKLEEEVENTERKTVFDQVVEFLETHDGQLMKGSVNKDRKFVRREEMTEEQRLEINLYGRWRNSKEREIFEKYQEEPIEKVPEEYREKIVKLRDLIKTVFDQVVEFLETHNGQLMRGCITKNGKRLIREEMTEEEREEINLYSSWRNLKEREILEQYEGNPIEKVPEGYREKISKLRNLIRKEKTVYDQVIEFLKTHNGQPMRGSITKNGKQLIREKMTKEEIGEINLYYRWNRTEEKNILDQYAGEPIEEVPEEYREKIAKLREYGLGKEEKTLFEEVIDFLKNHNGKRMRGAIIQNGKKLIRKEMTENEIEEVNLYDRWYNSKERKILDQYAGEPIESVPEEYRKKIAKLREYGLGKKKNKIKGQELGQTTFKPGTRQCDEAGDVLSKAIEELNREEAIINNGDE